MSGKQQIWAAWELVLLGDRLLSHREVAERTGRPLPTVARRRQQLGITSVKVNQSWMDWEFTLLRDTSRSIAEVASLTGRTSGACRRKADLLGLGPRVLPSAAGRVRSRFSATEDDLILELWDDLSITDLAVFLGRSPAAVGKRIHRLGLRDGFPVGPEHWNWKDGASQNASYGWRGPDWPEVRAQVMDRDGFTCQDGGEFIPSGSGLVVHHVIPWRLRQVNDPQWLVTLCTSHHMQRPEHKWRDLPPEVEEQLKLFRLAS